MAAHKKHDWPTIAADYIEGWQNGDKARHMPTLAEIAAKWGINSRVVNDKAALDKWTTKREEFQKNVQQERQRYQLRELARAGQLFTIKIADLDGRLLDLINKNITALAKRKKMAPAKELASLSLALKNAQAVGMTALGIDPDYPQKSLEDVMAEPEGSPMKRLGRTLYVEIVPKPPPEAHGDEKDE